MGDSPVPQMLNYASTGGTFRWGRLAIAAMLLGFFYLLLLANRLPFFRFTDYMRYSHQWLVEFIDLTQFLALASSLILGLLVLAWTCGRAEDKLRRLLLIAAGLCALEEIALFVDVPARVAPGSETAEAIGGIFDIVGFLFSEIAALLWMRRLGQRSSFAWVAISSTVLLGFSVLARTFSLAGIVDYAQHPRPDPAVWRKMNFSQQLEILRNARTPLRTLLENANSFLSPTHLGLQTIFWIAIAIWAINRRHRSASPVVIPNA